MTNYDIYLHKNTLRGVACLLFLFAGSAVAAPTIQQVSGKMDHKSTVTITGLAFGSKATPAPVVWDDASGSNLLGKWSGYWPNSGNTAYQMHYTTPIRGIGLPHNRVGKYITGCHGDNNGPAAGYNVVLWKNRTVGSFPQYTYASWYYRLDDNWVFNTGSPADNNMKHYDYSCGTEPMTTESTTWANWYVAYGPPSPHNSTEIPSWLYTGDKGSLMNPDMNGHNAWWGAATNPAAGKWVKVEVEIKLTNQKDGYIKLWDNGVLRMNYVGSTDPFNASDRRRIDAIGGYARGSGQPNNCRYFADAYLDYTRARVVLANNADYSKATIIEPQIPSAWSDSTLKVSVNLGKFTAGQTAYLFVFDASGQRNATGFPVTAGNESNAPSPPTNLTLSYNN